MALQGALVASTEWPRQQLTAGESGGLFCLNLLGSDISRIPNREDAEFGSRVRPGGQTMTQTLNAQWSFAKCISTRLALLSAVLLPALFGGLAERSSGQQQEADPPMIPSGPAANPNPAPQQTQQIDSPQVFDPEGSLQPVVQGAAQPAPQPTVTEVANPEVRKFDPSEYRLSEPFQHKNLTVFLVYGKDLLQGKFLTLEEALKQKVVEVKETGTVNQLTATNKGQLPVFICGGDIVKGGKQDRTLPYDLVLLPGQKAVPLPSFCVEQGRWAQRGAEKTGEFASSGKALYSKALKLAARHQFSQRDVWANVPRLQRKLQGNVQQLMLNTASPTSLQLTAEDKNLQKEAAQYQQALEKLTAKARQPDAQARQEAVLGLVVAVNGEMNSADVYASSALFQKLWPKLLEAACLEAIAERPKESKEFPSVSKKDAWKLFTDSHTGKAKGRKIGEKMLTVLSETKGNLLLESRQSANPGDWLRRSYFVRDEPVMAQPAIPGRNVLVQPAVPNEPPSDAVPQPQLPESNDFPPNSPEPNPTASESNRN